MGIRGEKKMVTLNISKDPVEIKGQPLVTVSVFGPCSDVEESIDEMIKQLSDIYQSMLQTYKREQELNQPPPMDYGPPPPMRRGGYDDPYGPPPPMRRGYD